MLDASLLILSPLRTPASTAKQSWLVGTSVTATNVLFSHPKDTQPPADYINDEQAGLA